MKVEIRRIVFNGKYTEGKLYIGNEYFCDTLEDPCRDDNHNGWFDGGETKVAGDTCIPCGTYKVTFEATTLGLARRAKGGLIPLLHDVPSFTSVRIHQGNTTKDTRGCILLGRRDAMGHVADSTDTCLAFFGRMDYSPFELTIRDIL